MSLIRSISLFSRAQDRNKGRIGLPIVVVRFFILQRLHHNPSALYAVDVYLSFLYYRNRKYQTQVSITAGTLFHSTNLPLVKWFWAIYPTAADKGGISGLRLAKHFGVSWPTARQMLKKIRVAMADRDSVYRLQNLIEFDDAYVGGKRTGKRGRGAAGKRPILVSVETREEKAGFMAVEAVDIVSKEPVREFLQKHLKECQTVRKDAYPALNPVSQLALWPWVGPS